MSESNPSLSEPSGNFELTGMISLAKTNGNSKVGILLELFRNYLRLIAQTQINAKLKTRIDPSDVVQETFLDAHRDFGAFRGQTEAELIAWLRKILACNICDQAKRHGAMRRDIQREQSLEAAMDQSSVQLANALGGHISTPSRQAAKREQAVMVADAIANLPDEYRYVIIQRQVHRVCVRRYRCPIGQSRQARCE